MTDTVDEVIEKWKKVRDMYNYQSLPKTGLDIVIDEVERLRAELAAAKAASAVPVKVNSVWADHGSGRVTAYCKNLDDAMEFESWLRDRIWERGEG